MKVFIALSFIFFQTALTATEVLLLGGGGEGKKEDTIFDYSIHRLAMVKDYVGLNVTSSFNGGHPKTEGILKDELKVENTPFTEENYLARINEYVQKINSGAIKPGEKLMVILDTHGAQKSPLHKTHAVSLSGSAGVSDYNQLSHQQLTSADKLMALTEAAKAKGIKLAILDFSCHSGNSLALANENTCVISSAGTDHYGYTNFANLFYNKMEKGKSLEDIFIKSRKEQNYPSFPMISTEVGKLLNQEQYPLFSPYLNSIDRSGKADKLSPYLKTLFDPINQCQREENFASLVSQLEAFEKVHGALERSFGRGENLLDVLKAYKADQDGYLEKLKLQGAGVFNTVETITWGTLKNRRTGKLEPRSEKLTYRDILSYAPENLQYIAKERTWARTLSEKKEAHEAYERYSKIIEKQQEILARYPNLRGGQLNFSDLRKDWANIETKTQKITDLSNQFYEARYYELKAKESKKSEPCRDFIL